MGSVKLHTRQGCVLCAARDALWIGCVVRSVKIHRSPFLDFMDGGAWLPVGGGVICLVNFVNERDLSLLSSFG